MKAEEVLRRYAAGERNFRGADLRGQTFKGKDLSGADFSHADVRGTNFSYSILNGADFIGIKAGLSKRIFVSQQIIFTLLSIVLTFTSTLIRDLLENSVPPLIHPSTHSLSNSGTLFVRNSLSTLFSAYFLDSDVDLTISITGIAFYLTAILFVFF